MSLLVRQRSEGYRLRDGDKITAERDWWTLATKNVFGPLGITDVSIKVGLDAILGLLTDIGDVYAKAEPAERRMLNRALFDRITIDDEDEATLQPTEAIQTILATNPRPHNERTLPRDHAGQGSNVQLWVEPRRLELLTSALQRRRSTN